MLRFFSSLTSSGPDPKHASIGGWDVPVKLAARASRDRKQRKGEETKKWHEGKLDWTVARIKLRVIARKWDKHQHRGKLLIIASSKAQKQAACKSKPNATAK